MESSKLKIISAFLLLACLCSRGEAVCSLSDLVVTQTGSHVTVENRCICTQTNMKLSCAGFDESAVRGEPGVISRDAGAGDLCTLVGGGPVTNDSSVSFDYAGKTSVSFTPVSSTINCS
uniref:Uncharacterized protein n=1 Tax=Leersia perrieri TaxID=77586 RepID=A0A0D9XSH4_9ORYZ